MKPLVCPACGARLPADATHCDLCGHDLKAPVPAEAEDEGGAREEVAPAPAAVSAPQGNVNGPFCVQCGARNPAYARFCYQCGHALHTAPASENESAQPAAPVTGTPPPTPPPTFSQAPSPRPDSDAGRRALVLLGAGILAVVVLFFVTQVSKDQPPPAALGASASPAPPPTSSAATPLPSEVEARVASLDDEIAGATGEERLAKQEALARLLAQASAFDRAAPVQQEIAEARQTALAWADAGSYYLAHMLRMQGPERVSYAQQAAAAYERSLELDPADLDVKTDLATAYLNDQQNPMLAVQTVKDVLAEAPDHVRANFNYGLMLAQINRSEQALEQFDKVVALTEPGDPVHQRAEQERARLRAAASGTASG